MLVPSVSELLVILGIVVVIFGGAKLPKLGSDVGQAIKNFKQGLGQDEPAQAQSPKQIQDQASQPKA
jgi:sec-independent protein translocase protein TatA